MTEFPRFDRGMSCRSSFGGHHWGGEGIVWKGVKDSSGTVTAASFCPSCQPEQGPVCETCLPDPDSALCLGGFHSAGVPPASPRCPVPVTSGDCEARYWKSSKDQALRAPLRFKENPEFLQVFPSSLLLKRKHSYFLEEGLSDPHNKRKESGEGRERR